MHSYLTGLHSAHKFKKLHKNQSFATRFTRGWCDATEDPESPFKLSINSQTIELSYGVGEDVSILLSCILLSTGLRKFHCLQCTVMA